MRRREFLIFSAFAATPSGTAALAQNKALPAVGFLSNYSSTDRPELLKAFLGGLSEAGFVDGRNVSIDYRFANHESERLPELVGNLIDRRVAVIVATGGTYAALAARKLTSTIPILFASGVDPVSHGLVSSLNRPEANVTGVSWFASEIGTKQVEMIRELLPKASRIGVLVNRNSAESALYEPPLLDAARSLNISLIVKNGNSAATIASAFEDYVNNRVDGIIVTADPFLSASARTIAKLAMQHALPGVFFTRDFVAFGGLVSYGSNINEAYNILGRYAGRILHGDTPSRLPVYRGTRFQMTINLVAAKSLGIEVPPALLARADEVIE